MAFPDGSMTARGLRRQIARGHLTYEVIAGKHYTTLADIEEMRKLCRIQAKVRAPSGSCVTVKGVTLAGLSPQELLRARLDRSLKRKPKSSPTKPVAKT
ncbi:excisionase [Bradyrhizobium sp. S3.2.12]|uniref:excisionase n=1 Tax=Bradyrhizobium sp. S3.2.12 TaxID=3156387 RepID=UPI003395D7AC